MDDTLKDDVVKKNMMDLAISEKWTPEQIQFAEDYIDAYRLDHRAKRPPLLRGDIAKLIRNRVRSKN